MLSSAIHGGMFLVHVGARTEAKPLAGLGCRHPDNCVGRLYTHILPYVAHSDGSARELLGRLFGFGWLWPCSACQPPKTSTPP